MTHATKRQTKHTGGLSNIVDPELIWHFLYNVELQFCVYSIGFCFFCAHVYYIYIFINVL